MYHVHHGHFWLKLAFNKHMVYLQSAKWFIVEAECVLLKIYILNFWKLCCKLIFYYDRVDMFTFTFMHLADAFIQSDLQCIQVMHVLSVCMCSLGIEPTTFALLTQCSNHWATGTHVPQEHMFSLATCNYKHNMMKIRKYKSRYLVYMHQMF